MKGRRFIYLLLALVLIFAVQCAKQSAPQGGPRDQTPPVIVKSEPPNGTVNFVGNSFEVTFDEYIVLDNVLQKLLVSPPMEEQPLVRVKGKSVEVTFEDELIENVTYTFYFQDAIKDLNEGNAFENFQFVFSTGPTLDSLSITGTIVDGYTLNPGENLFVLLYTGKDDTVPKTTIPDYLTRSLSDGSFRIDNIKEGNYTLYGLGDANNNRKYDLEDEVFAFIDSTINLTPANNYISPMPDTLKSKSDSASYKLIPGNGYELFTFVAENKLQYLSSSDRKSAYQLTYTFSRAVDSGDFDIQFPGVDEVQYISQVNQGRDTFNIWLTDSTFYNEQIITSYLSYPRSDTNGIIIPGTDTIDMRYVAPSPQRGRGEPEVESLSYKTNLSARTGIKPGQKIYYKFEAPVVPPDTSLIKLFVGSDSTIKIRPYKLYPDTLIDNRFWFEADYIEGNSYTLSIGSGAFRDQWGHTTDSTGIKFGVAEKEKFGTLTMNLSGLNGNLIIQLLRPDEKPVEERYITLPEDSKVKFEYLDKGQYIMKAIFDLNGDGKWNTGDYDIHLQPEPVTYYPKKIEIKLNWDLEENWTISEIRKKSKAVKPSSASPAGR